MNNDEALAEMARTLPPDAYLTLLAETDDAARAAKHKLSILTRVGLERTDVTSQQVADALGIDRRTVYKRRDQL